MIELLIVCVALLFSFFFAGFETGFISLNYIDVLYHAKREKSKAFTKILKLFDKKELIISILLVGNNIAIVVATLFFSMFLKKTFTTIPHMEVLQPIIVLFTLTPMFFFFGELLPKSLFKTYPYHMVEKTYPLFKVIYILLYIPGYVFYVISKIVISIINKIFHNRSTNDNYVVGSSISRTTDISPKVINSLLENKISIRENFKAINSSSIFDIQSKFKEIHKLSFPIFVSRKGKIIGVVTEKNYERDLETKLQFLYHKLTFYHNVESIDITKITTHYIVIKEKNHFFYCSREILLRKVLQIED